VKLSTYEFCVCVTVIEDLKLQYYISFRSKCILPDGIIFSVILGKDCVECESFKNTYESPK